MIVKSSAKICNEQKLKLTNNLERALEPFKGSDRGELVAGMCDDATIPANWDSICCIITLLWS